MADNDMFVTGPPNSSSEVENDSDSTSSDFMDSPGISPSDVDKYGVVISAPLIYIDSDETECRDKVTANLRVIPYQKLLELMQIAVKIITGDKSKQHELAIEIFDMLNCKGRKIDEFLEFIKFGVEIANELDISEEYVDLVTHGVSFDIIRNYVVDPNTKILKSAEPTTIGGYQLYSQIENENDKNKVRVMTNESDFNRMQYLLAHMEKILTFEPGYVCNQTVKIINLGLFYLCLYYDSAPIIGHCNTDLKSNMLAYILDCVVRSRVIQAWQRDKSTKPLLKDVLKHYDNRNHIAKIIQLPSSKLRGQFVLKIVGKYPELKNLLDETMYDAYISIFNRFILEINSKKYHLLTTQYIIDLSAMMSIVLKNLDTLKSACGTSSSKTGITKSLKRKATYDETLFPRKKDNCEHFQNEQTVMSDL